MRISWSCMPLSCNSITHSAIRDNVLPSQTTSNLFSQLLADCPPDRATINGIDFAANGLARIASKQASKCLGSSLLSLELIRPREHVECVVLSDIFFILVPRVSFQGPARHSDPALYEEPVSSLIFTGAKIGIIIQSAITTLLLCGRKVFSRLRMSEYTPKSPKER